MRILLISVRSDFGGGPRHLDQLINNLPSDIEIFLAYPPNGDPYGNKWEKNDRIKKHFHLPYRKFSIKTLFSLKKFALDNKIDIIHSHGNGAGFYSRLLKFIGIKSKIIHTFHGISNNHTNALKGIANTISGRIFKYFTDCFICVSKGEYALAQEKKFIIPQKTKIIYNGIEKITTLQKQPHQFDVVTLSRFDYQKNMDKALEIARLLNKEDIHFTWVGDGQDFNRLKKTAEQEKLNISFIGFSNEPFKYLESASIYLSTARFEGLPYALIEAASVGLPIIATNVIGNNETLENGKSGYLFNTEKEAINYILCLKNNPSLYTNMVLHSQRYFEEHFSLNKMINKLEEIYQFINYSQSN